MQGSLGLAWGLWEPLESDLLSADAKLELSTVADLAATLGANKWDNRLAMAMAAVVGLGLMVADLLLRFHEAMLI